VQIHSNLLPQVTVELVTAVKLMPDNQDREQKNPKGILFTQFLLFALYYPLFY